MPTWATAASYCILGPLCIAAPPAPQGQQGRVLSLLLVERDRVVSTAALAHWALGPDRSADAAQIHVLIARLRRLLRERGLPGAVVSDGGGYRFQGEPGLIDAGRFDELVDASLIERDRDPVTARRLVENGLTLWRGDVLDGQGMADHPAVARLADRRLAAVELGFTLDLALGTTDTLPDMLDAHRRYPDRERLTLITMTALFLAGRQTEALAVYQRARQRSASLSGLEPGVALRQAEQAILRHDVSTILSDHLGIDASRRTTPTRPARRSSASTGSNRRTGGPRFVTSFVGRAELLESIIGRVTTAGLTTLVGPGGVGKTRLLCEALDTPELDHRPIWFCEVAQLDDGTSASTATSEDDGLTRLVARVVGARLVPGRLPLDAVVEHLSSADAVLVLDSCETQLEEAARLASRLTAEAPRLSIAATSRMLLGVAGEQGCVIPPLDPGSDAADLYCHRAIDADPGFSLAVDELDPIAALCRRLDGLPLAIELAAARIRAAGPHELLRHLDEAPLRFLRSARPAEGTQRHRSLHATIDWSYRLLGPDQQRLLRALAVFSGAVVLDDIMAVCDRGHGPSELLDRLSRLVEHSMIVTARSGGVTSYRLLDTIRAFALDRAAAAGELEELRQDHARYCTAVLDDIRPALRGPHEAAAVERLHRLWPELRTAVGWAIRSANTELAVRLVAGLGFEAVFRERGEIVGWADDVLALPAVLDQDGADELLGTAALADWGYGRFDRGLARAEHAVALHHERATVLSPDVAAALPLHLSLRGDLPATVALLHAHAIEAERDGVPFAQTHTTICEAMSLGFAGADEADEVLERAERLAARLGCPLLQAIAAFTRAIVILDRRPQEAVLHARRCLTIAAGVGATWFLSAGSNYLVAALARSSRPEQTVEPLRSALERQRKGGTIQSVANTIRNTIVLLDRLGRTEPAATLIGWLGVNRPSIPGTPGMRDHPVLLAGRLRRALGDAAFDALHAAGADLSIEQAIRFALSELADLGIGSTPPRSGAGLALPATI